MEIHNVHKARQTDYVVYNNYEIGIVAIYDNKDEALKHANERWYYSVATLEEYEEITKW